MLPITIANVGLFVVIGVVMVLLDPLLGVISSLSIPVLLYLVNQIGEREYLPRQNNPFCCNL